MPNLSEQKKSELEDKLRELLHEYHHYKCMSSGFLGMFKGWGSGMSLVDFMLWLNSRK